MSWSRRSAVAGLFALSACGFTPAYGPSGSAAALRNAIRLRDPATREEYDFAARLEDRLGVAPAATYQIGYQISTSSQGLAITPDQVIQRYNLIGSVTYTVTDTATNTVVSSGSASNFTGYSTTGSIVATRAAEKDAYARLMVLLADKVVTDLIASAPRWLP